MNEVPLTTLKWDTNKEYYFFRGQKNSQVVETKHKEVISEDKKRW